MKPGCNLDVELEGRGLLTIRPNDHVATGGEGSVYRAKGTVIKIYSDREKMRRDAMAEKIKLLSGIIHRNIIAPKGLVKTPYGEPIGYYMPYADGEHLPPVFTNDFRKRTGFNDDNASVLVANMREVVRYSHGKGAVLVDANEMNWLVDLKDRYKPEPLAIDVDSWAIGRWKASVIMPSIRDWHSKDFNQSTDWFSWGVVTFQVYTGIHPYKGGLNGYKPNELERRMKENASVFSPGIRLNSAVRDFSIIPGRLLDWYRDTFLKGKREVPPSPFDTGVATAPVARILRATTTATGLLVFEKLYEKTGDQAIRVFPCGVVLLESGALTDIASRRQIGNARSHECEVIKVKNGWLIADMQNRNTVFFFVNSASLKMENLDLCLQGRKYIRYENRIFMVTERGLTEAILTFLGKPFLSAGQTWGAMINSTRWFDGLGIQDAMGAMYVIAPFGENACTQIRVRELDGMTPVAAKAGNRFMVIIALDKNGIYQKLELTLDKGYQSYKLWQGATDVPDHNIAILPKGVCATIVADGELHIFVPISGAVTKVEDKNISADMALGNWEDKVVYIHNGAVWKVRMK